MTKGKPELPMEIFQDILEQHAERLIERAQLWGFVVTIETQPLEPFAMGHHKMVPHVRIKRKEGDE